MKKVYEILIILLFCGFFLSGVYFFLEFEDNKKKYYKIKSNNTTHLTMEFSIDENDCVNFKNVDDEMVKICGNFEIKHPKKK